MSGRTENDDNRMTKVKNKNKTKKKLNNLVFFCEYSVPIATGKQSSMAKLISLKPSASLFSSP